MESFILDQKHRRCNVCNVLKILVCKIVYNIFCFLLTNRNYIFSCSCNWHKWHSVPHWHKEINRETYVVWRYALQIWNFNYSYKKVKRIFVCLFFRKIRIFEFQINFLLCCSLCLSIQLERSWRKYNEQTRLKTILGQIACIWPLPKQSLHFLHLPRWQNPKWIAELSLCSSIALLKFPVQDFLSWQVHPTGVHHSYVCI